MNDLINYNKEIIALDTQDIPFDYLRPHEARKLIDATTNDRDHLLLNTMWQTGARISEVLTLRPCDVDENGITIDTLKKRLCEKRRTKSGSWAKLPKPILKEKKAKRIIPIQQALLSEFMSYAYKNKLEPDAKFFDIGRARAFQIVDKASEDTKIGKYKNIHPHLFRHGFAVNYLFCGGLFPNLKKLLGHSSILTTMIYLRLTQSDIKQDIDKIMF